MAAKITSLKDKDENILLPRTRVRAVYDDDNNSLVDILNGLASFTTSSGTFDGLGWSSQSDGTYTQTVAVLGVTADSDVLIFPTADYREAYAKMNCKIIAQATDSITFSCTSPQDASVVVRVRIFN